VSHHSPFLLVIHRNYMLCIILRSISQETLTYNDIFAPDLMPLIL
jgi:hypothetical protein